MPLKAIPTRYNNYYFRSRLEARWATYFDCLGIKYRYEMEGYDLGNGVRYLPDFTLPDFGGFFEAKPAGQIDSSAALKASKLAVQSRREVFVFAGDCWITTPGTVFFENLEYPGRSCYDGPIYWSLCPSCSHPAFANENTVLCRHCHLVAAVGRQEVIRLRGDRRIQDAFNTARAARFEHGEQP